MTTKIINLIRKRDGRLQNFQPDRITNAVSKAFEAVDQPDREKAEALCRSVVSLSISL